MGTPDYKLIRELGKGAFGTVYLIQHQSNDEVFALKTVDLGRASDAEKESAAKEAQLMSELDHDHLVRYVASYFKGRTLFIFTEFCEGGDLSNFLEDTSDKLPEDLVVCWVAQTTSALKYLHDRNILHRDLKPANVYLSGEGDVKLGDLGIARVLDKGMDMATTMAGTPCYMSPEIFQMKGYNHKTDIWSFGCVVYEMAAGQRAFDAPIIQFLMFKIIAGIIPPIHGDYSSDLKDLVKKMMAKDPDERPSASEVLRMNPVRRFVQNPKRPRAIMKESKLKTKWGTHESTRDLATMMKAMDFTPPTFDMRDLRIPVDSLQLHRQRMGMTKMAAPVHRDEPVTARGGAAGGGIYGTIVAGKAGKKHKVEEKNLDVTLKQATPKSEMSEGRAAIMQHVRQGLMGLVEASRAPESAAVSSSSSSSESEQDTLRASGQASTKKAIEAGFLMRQIQILQGHCAKGIGQDTLMQAYKIMDSVPDPAQLKERLIKLIGQDKFREYGDKIMYLRLFEVGLDKVQSQMKKM